MGTTLCITELVIVARLSCYIKRLSGTSRTNAAVRGQDYVLAGTVPVRSLEDSKGWKPLL